MKKKILIFLRTSTEKQELDNQKKELKDYLVSMGYCEDDFIYLEKAGASAIKLNEEYINMIEQLNNFIENGVINCVALWGVDRLLRDEEIWSSIKKKLVENKIQLIVKNPSFTLLNPDGSINQGSELALSLFTTMSVQEMRTKKERFKRTKKANAAKGKYNGGCNILYGYKVDENNYYQIDEEEGKIVSTIFELYSTGKYSAESLSKELLSRGIYLNKGKITHILYKDAYCGKPQERYNYRTYPAIISEELYNKCVAIRKENKILTKGGNKLCLSAKLIRCVECGSLYTANQNHYACCKHTSLGTCSYTLTIKKAVIDNLLWRVASTIHLQVLTDISENKVEEYKKEIEIIENKINVIDDKLSKVQEKIDRVIDLFVEGVIDTQNKADRLLKIKNESKSMADERNALNEAKNRLYGLINTYANGGNEIDTLMDALNIIEGEENKTEYRYEIIHQYIQKVHCWREWFGKERDIRVKKENGVKIDIITITNQTWRFMYVPCAYKGCNLFVWNGSEYLPDAL